MKQFSCLQREMNGTLQTRWKHYNRIKGKCPNEVRKSKKKMFLLTRPFHKLLPRYKTDHSIVDQLQTVVLSQKILFDVDSLRDYLRSF